MSNRENITIKKPTSLFLKKVEIKPKFLFEILSGTIKLGRGDLGEGIETIVNSFFDTEVINNPEEIAWELVFKSVMKSVYKLTHEVIINNDGEDIKTENLNLDEVEKEIIMIFDNEILEINNIFFDNPKENDLIKNILEFFGKFLRKINVEEADVNNLKSRFPRYYVSELANEWSNSRDKYREILRLVEETPFEIAKSKEEEWFFYYESIRLDIEKSMFGETFSIKDIYVDLRGYYCDGLNDRGENKKIIIYVKEELKEWLNKEDKNDCLKIISGGPGYGKTTLLKILSSELTFLGNYKVIYIPLQDYYLKKELEEGVKKFLEDGDCLKQIDPFKENKLLLIYDGLDELAMTGKSLETVAKDFINHIKNEMNSKNRKNIKIKIILSGRDIIIQNNESEFRNKNEIIHLLPFYGTYNYEEYIDEKKLLDIDQRNIWWEKYGELKGIRYKKLPAELNVEELKEITSYPLLNYLLVLSYERGKVEFNNNTNINYIYEDLITAIYERSWSERTHKTVEHMEYKSFVAVFEKIALSIWQGSGRKTTLNEIKKNYERDMEIEKFICSGGRGLTSLLIAFYFKKTDFLNDGEDSFEFTHKSFGEFLTARILLKNLYAFKDELQKKEKNKCEGKDEKEIALMWTKLFGFRELDSDILRFVINEFKIKYNENSKEVEELQEYIVKIFNFVLQNGSQTEIEEYNIAHSKVINSEKAFFYILGSVARITNKLSQVRWRTNKQFGDLISRLIGQRIGREDVRIDLYGYLNHLNLSESFLLFRDFLDVNFYGSNLEKSKLRESNLRGADLRNTNLKNTDLRDSSLEIAKLKGSNLSGANLRRTNLKEVDLRESNLQSVDLGNVNLEKSNLEKADLTGAYLEWANLRGTKLDGAIVTKEQLKKAILK